MVRKKNSRLTHKERVHIEIFLNENKSKIDTPPLH